MGANTDRRPAAGGMSVVLCDASAQTRAALAVMRTGCGGHAVRRDHGDLGGGNAKGGG